MTWQGTPAQHFDTVEFDYENWRATSRRSIFWIVSDLRGLTAGLKRVMVRGNHNSAKCHTPVWSPTALDFTLIISLLVESLLQLSAIFPGPRRGAKQDQNRPLLARRPLTMRLAID